VVSAPSPTTAGVATIIDYAGDTIMAQVPIGPGPAAFTIDEYGSNGYTYNTDHTISNFPVSTSLQPKNVSYTTLPVSAQPLNIDAPANALWIGDLAGNLVDTFANTPAALKLSIPMAPASTPVFVAGSPTTQGQREYVISQNLGSPTGVECNLSPKTQPNGVATPIEMASSTTDLPIPVGKCPVFGLQSPDQRRLFVLNRGDDTITVINSQNNALDACTPFLNQNGQVVNCHPVLPLSTTAVVATGVTPVNGTSGMPVTAGPVYAEYNVAKSLLVVADYDGGTISVIDVSTDEYGNDGATFGTTYTIPVGKNPASVTVLFDGTRAYTANQGDYTAGCAISSCNGTVTIVNLSSHTVEKTLPVVGVPRTVVSTQSSLYGKVFVASTNSPYLTILTTETDLVDTTVLVPGDVVDVRATSQSGASQTVNTYFGSVSISNPNYSSRVPGYGQPCNLPPGLMSASYTLAQCSQLP
jgi:DNA-binding beta-propeller fold protein YncE